MFMNARNAFLFSNHLHNSLSYPVNAKAYAENASLNYRYLLAHEKEIERSESCGSSLVENIHGLRDIVVADCKSWSEGCGSFFSFFAARRSPFTQSLALAFGRPTATVALCVSYCVEFGGMYIHPLSCFPFSFCIAFPSFSHTVARV